RSAYRNRPMGASVPAGARHSTLAAGGVRLASASTRSAAAAAEAEHSRAQASKAGIVPFTGVPFRRSPWPAENTTDVGRPSQCIAVGPPQQFVEMVHAALAQRVQPARDVGARRQPALHVLADAEVFVLHFVAEAEVGLAPRTRFARIVGRVVEIEL